MSDPDDRDSKPKTSAEEAKDQLKQGLSMLWRAAQDVAATVKKEIDRDGVGKVVDDAGREVARAAQNVFARFEAELHPPRPEGAHEASGVTEWPTTLDEYERRYGPIRGGDWPRSPDEYATRFGEPPPERKPTGPTRADPGFRIAIDDDEPK